MQKNKRRVVWWVIGVAAAVAGYYYMFHTPLAFCPALERDILAGAFEPRVDKRVTFALQRELEAEVESPNWHELVWQIPHNPVDMRRVRCHAWRSDDHWRADVDYVFTMPRGAIEKYRVVWLRRGLRWRVAMIAENRPLK